MFQYVEKGNIMYEEKVKHQRQELEAARKRNEELKNNLKILEDENKALKQRFDENQLQVMTSKNDLNILIGQLNKEKRQHMEITQRLQIFNEQIEMLTSKEKELSSLTPPDSLSPPPTPEQLSFKQSVEECLRDMMIQTKLRQAEIEENILDLKKQLEDLEGDVKEIRGTDVGSISQWQKEFLDAKLREAELSLEFGKIKRTLVEMSNELNEQKTITDLQSKYEDNFSIIFNKIDKQHEKIRSEKDMALANALDLQQEIHQIRKEIRRLEATKEDFARRIKSNEELKANLYVVRGSIFFRQHEKNQEIEAWREKTRKLEHRMRNKLKEYEIESEKKDDLILDLVDKVETVKIKIDDIAASRPTTETLSENRVKSLEDTRNKLEEKISSLQPS